MCPLHCFARSCAGNDTRSEEVSIGDQHQNSQSRGRRQKLHEIASPPPKISRSRSASFICRLGTARQVLRLLNILVQGYTSPKQARRRKSWPITHWKSRRPYVTQTQQLFSVIEEAIQKSERGAHGAGTGAMPSIPMVAGFKDVQDRVVEIAKKNAESGFALVEKIAKAQNLQEIVTLQTRFAQEQMQAYAAQMQELQGLIGETLQKLQRG